MFDALAAGKPIVAVGGGAAQAGGSCPAMRADRAGAPGERISPSRRLAADRRPCLGDRGSARLREHVRRRLSPRSEFSAAALLDVLR